jgi:hypothetical protein
MPRARRARCGQEDPHEAAVPHRGRDLEGRTAQAVVRTRMPSGMPDSRPRSRANFARREWTTVREDSEIEVILTAEIVPETHGREL